MSETPDLKELMRMAQEMQQNMKEAHEDLSRQEFVGEAGNGLVKVVMNGRHDTKRVVIDPKALEEGLEYLADLLMAANNAAIRSIEKASEAKMMLLSKKLGIPGSAEGSEN
jgi:DNA-binding YbaB/EbfC family protein